ncbi:MAG: serine/threonine protein kinase [Gemmataceae bacterium]|nr:serine/threonine protein kinase [Gemmataceae bacterium]
MELETRCSPDGPRQAVSDDSLDDPRLTQALEEYLAVLEAGPKPDRAAFLARYADIAESLTGCLQGLELMVTTAPRLVPAVPPPPPLAPVDATAALGDYRIVREIGRGGMGVVYEAMQLSLGRRVALKVLPFAAALDEKQLQRFKNEAQAAAHLHHNSIVPVFAVGCERGVYYYAMQFIEGRPLSAYIQELRQRAGLDGVESGGSSDAPTREGRPSTPVVTQDPPTVLGSTTPHAAATTCHGAATVATERLDRDAAFFRLVARLGVQAAEALEYAHQQGIVHRDVKPANLLVDPKEHLWITDFGLARCQNDAGLTVSGDLVGTVRYMSPEQALARRGLVDHRTDIYALGATLYELLTLQPVFTGTDRRGLLHQIAFEDPRAPRDLCPAMPDELETIVLKALGKTPEERYTTAQDMADDLQRFLEDRPILARRPSFREKATKWVRRHRVVAVSAFVVLFLAAVGGAVSTILIAQEQARTRRAFEGEAAQRGRAEENFRQARSAVDFFVQLSEEEMADRPEMQGVRRKLLEAAREYYQEFIDQHHDDATVQAELASTYLRVGRILGEMGAHADALASTERAREIQEKLLRDNPTAPELQHGLSNIYQTLGLLQGGSQFLLLTHKSVQEDLKLSEEQVKKITPLAESRRDFFRDYRHRSPEEWRKKLDELSSHARTLEAILNPEQGRRLAQIAIQQQGTRAFMETDVADALQLTSDQRQKIRIIHDELFGVSTRYGPPGGGWKKPDDSAKIAKEQILNVLTAEQKAKWKELTGEPFKGEIRHGFFGGHGPPSGPDIRRRP